VVDRFTRHSRSRSPFIYNQSTFETENEEKRQKVVRLLKNKKGEKNSLSLSPFDTINITIISNNIIVIIIVNEREREREESFRTGTRKRFQNGTPSRERLEESPGSGGEIKREEDEIGVDDERRRRRRFGRHVRTDATTTGTIGGTNRRVRFGRRRSWTDHATANGDDDDKEERTVGS
jgi:hypothetical protein